jgi:hypothetical protein
MRDAESIHFCSCYCLNDDGGDVCRIGDDRIAGELKCDIPPPSLYTQRNGTCTGTNLAVKRSERHES